MTGPWTAVRQVGAPTAVLDVDRFEANSAALLRRAAGTPIRVASKSIRVRSLIERLLAQPGYAGVLGYSATEAIWLARNGIDDIVIAYPTVDADAVATIAADERLASAITFMIDLPEHVTWLARHAGEHPLRVAIDVDCSLRIGRLALGAHRSAVHDADGAGRLAVLVADQSRLCLVGMMFYEAQVAGVPDAKPGMRIVKRLSNDQLHRNRSTIRAAVEQYAELEFVNGGGTGSLHTTRLDPAITELAAGSGLFAPTSFDGFDELGVEPAAFFVSPVTRKPAPDIVVTFAGGYAASGAAGKSRLPRPVHPEGLRYFGQEGAGEVQSPLHGAGARDLAPGDPVWFRHAKAGEMCERFDELVLVSGGEVVGTASTYRGEGKNFG